MDNEVVKKINEFWDKIFEETKEFADYLIQQDPVEVMFFVSTKPFYEDWNKKRMLNYLDGQLEKIEGELNDES